jgi:hypothetical protein
LLNPPLEVLAGDSLVLHTCRARVLRPSQSRPVLRYSLTYLDPRTRAVVGRVVIGKAYYRGDGAMTFRVMSRLWADGFDDDHLTIPTPVAYVPELNLLLQGRAPGKALYRSLEDPAGALPLVRLTARWLAKLHRARVAGAPLLCPEDEEEKVDGYRTALRQACPRFAPCLDRLAGRVIAAFRSLGPVPAVPTHGDFQPKNIFILRNRVTVIDFDRFALAPAGRDLGHFIGQCLTMSYVRTGSFRECEPWNAAFLDEYAGLAPPEALGTLPLYVARTFFEVLYYKLVVRPVKDPSFVPAWLDECARWLGKCPRPRGRGRRPGREAPAGRGRRPAAQERDMP